MNNSEHKIKKLSFKSISAFLFTIIFSFVFLGCNDEYKNKVTFLDVNTIYYTSNITETEVNNLGNYLVGQNFFDNQNQKDMKLDKQGNTYEFRVIIKKGLENDTDVINVMKVLCTELSQNVFNNNEVDIILCDDKFTDLRTVIAI